MQRPHALPLASRHDDLQRLRLMAGLAVSAAGAIALASQTLRSLAVLG